MATTKGAWKLQEVRDQILNSDWINYNAVFDANVAGTLWTWGYNLDGQLAQNNTIDSSSPVQIPGTSWLRSDQQNGCSLFYIKSNGTLWAWGYNKDGYQLGINDSALAKSSPTQIPGTQWCFVTSGEDNGNANNSYAIKTDNTAWVWGINRCGALGLNLAAGATSYSSPVQLPGAWCFFVANGCSAFGIKTDNTLWAWGENTSGALGLNNRVFYSSPVQVPGTQWCMVSSPNHATVNPHTIALKSDNTLWVWGNNLCGQVGTGNITNYSSPVQIPGSWCNTIASVGTTLAMKTNCTLWAWGNNSSGQLGKNNTVHYSSPVQIPGNWYRISATNFSGGNNNNTAFGIKTDSTLWAWGLNDRGQLANNSTLNTSSPVQIPGTNWYSVTGASISVLAKKYI